MLDAAMRRLIDPPLDAMGRVLAARGVPADHVTLIGLAFGLGSAVSIALDGVALGLVLIGLSRLADGLDGAIARASAKTDFGGFLDIVSDFVFYGAVPLGFVLADPQANAVAGAFLLATFYFNGASFLGYAVLAEKHGLKTSARGAKSLYFTGGLLEGTETIALFVAFCLWPSAFPALAWIFGALTIITASARLVLAWQVFGRRQ